MADRLAYLSPLPDERRGRVIYVSALDPEHMDHLRLLGYEPVELLSLPRVTLEDNQQYLMARAQAYEEGTVGFSQNDLKALELEMKANGMLDRKTMSLNMDVKVDKEDVLGLLNWKGSSHTLAGNSTVQSHQNLSKKKD